MSENHREIRDKMADVAVQELEAIRHPSAGTKAKNLAKSLLGRGSANVSDPIFWPAGLLLTGLTEYEQCQKKDMSEGAEEGPGKGAQRGQKDVSDVARSAAAEAYLAPWLQEGSPVRNPDDALTGTVLLALYEKTGNASYADAAEKICTYLKGCLRDRNGSIIYGQQSGNEWIYADGTGMTAMFLARYGRVFRDTDAMADARRQLINYLKCGMDPRSGLPYHGYDAQEGLKLGIIGWGRAVGWLLMGLSEYLICCPQDAEIAGMTRHIIDAILLRIRPDGLLSWQLDCTEGPLDTSASGMIFYSLLRLNRLCTAHAECSSRTGPSDADVKYTPNEAENTGNDLHHVDPARIDSAAAALYECIDTDGRVYWSSAECIDFAQYRQQYGHYAWAQGAVLAFLSLYENIR